MMAVINLSSKLPLILFSCFIIFSTTTTVEALVPLSKTFKYVNKGVLHLVSENDASYLPLPKITNHPFQLCFYNTTPNAFTLGLSMGFREDSPYGLQQIRRWVWAANPNRAVSESATLTFGRNGNLVLADADGRKAWQTNTANKGVIDLKLLPNGNLVLVDKDDRFVWQSFHYPTDTLLNGQGIHANGVNKLVSGQYSMVLNNTVNLYFKTKLSKKPLYYQNLDPSVYLGTVYFKSVSFFVWTPEIAIDGTDKPNELGLAYVGDVGDKSGGQDIWARPKYNSTLSMLRLGRDGNLRVYTYNEMGFDNEWEETYTYFSPSTSHSTCKLPEKCGILGLCLDNQCVACPTSKGLMGWSSDCKPEKLPPCTNTSGAGLISYYRIKEGIVRSIGSDEGEQELNVPFDKCKEKCSKDCKCVAYFTYDFGSCLIAHELYTLKSIFNPEVVDSYPIGYLKYSK